jgi:hypothetical protein
MQYESIARFLPGEFAALDLAIRDKLSETLSEALRVRGMKRELLAANLAEITGANIKAATLYNYTQRYRPDLRFPAAWVIPLCRITGNDSLQRLLLGLELAAALELGECAKKAIVGNCSQVESAPRR